MLVLFPNKIHLCLSLRLNSLATKGRLHGQERGGASNSSHGDRFRGEVVDGGWRGGDTSTFAARG